MKEWWESEWYLEWLKLAHNKPIPQDIGGWVFNSQLQIWIFQKPS